MTDDESLQDPMKELHDAILTAIVKFEDDNPRTKVTQIDRHRGGGHPPTPATPPYVRVRIRRFEKLLCYSSTSEGRPSDLK